MIRADLTGRVGDFDLDLRFDTPLDGVTAIAGPSGSGKTTLLRAIAGLERLAGRLEVAGEVWQDGTVFLPPHRRPVGFVFQEASLFSHLNVAGNLAYAARRAGLGHDDVAATAERLGLTNLMGRGVGRLSGGERQRVALARALLARPKLLLLDEPLAGLDREAKAGILPYLEALADEHTLPILYVSHDEAEVARLADRVITLRAGRVTG